MSRKRTTRTLAAAVVCYGALLSAFASNAFAARLEYELDGGFWFALSDGSSAHFAFNDDALAITDSEAGTVRITGTATHGGGTAAAGSVSSDVRLDLTYLNAEFLSDGSVVGRNSGPQTSLAAGSFIGGLSHLSIKFLPFAHAPAEYRNYGSSDLAFVLDPNGFGYHSWFTAIRHDLLTNASLDTVMGDFHARVTPRSSEVPEPASLGLLGAALIAAGRKRRRASSIHTSEIPTA